MGNKIKVVVGIPCTGYVQFKTCFSLAHAFRTIDVETDLLMLSNCDVVGSRTWIVHEARKRNATHLLFIDSDMFFPCSSLKDNPIRKLLDHKKDIVGAAYNKRQLPLSPNEVPVDPTRNTGLFKCETLGTGFLLIDMKVFDKLKEPYFQFGRGEDGQLVYGEDTWFCRRAIEAGFEVWADSTLGIKHIGEHLF